MTRAVRAHCRIRRLSSRGGVIGQLRRSLGLAYLFAPAVEFADPQGRHDVKELISGGVRRIHLVPQRRRLDAGDQRQALGHFDGLAGLLVGYTVACCGVDAQRHQRKRPR
ncbi:hypothetical protein [Deinococcus alpinitundrae]|uniref:hypothetical protein n=1 Tax=Deinococcus alpinitundrae TaxID=468913 RepID=UPI00137956FE|nr:hypothetical protein [Deinococcus alpinitundrae]